MSTPPVELIERRLLLAGNPTVRGVQFLDAAAAGTRPQLVVSFSADVGTTLSSADVEVRNVDTGARLAGSAISVAYNAAPHIATITFNPPGNPDSLPDGNYLLILHADGISAGGLPLDGNGDGTGGDDALFTFSSLRGDLNHDRRVDASDAAIISGSLNKPAIRLADGDFTGDGSVGFDDLLALAKHYNQSAARPADGDANGDGTVGFADLLQLAKHYRQSGGGDVDGDGTVTAADAAIVQAASGSALAAWPAVFAALSNDTGASASDGITTTPTVAGTVGAGAARLMVSLDSSDAVDASVALQGSAANARGFSLDRGRLQSLLGVNLDDGAHVLHLRSLDTSGATLGDAEVDFTLDTTPPSFVAIASPASGTTSSGLVTVQTMAADDVGIDRVSVLADGSVVGTATASPYSVRWDTSVENGSHSLQAIAYDLAGNSSSSTPVAVTVDNRAVTVTLDGSQRFQTIDGIGVNLHSDTWQNGEVVPQLDTLIDHMGASVFRVIVESVSGWEDTNDDADPQTYNWDYYNALYATPKFTDLWNTIGYLNQRGVTVLLNVMGTVPTWLGGTTVNNDDEYAEMIASMLDYATTVAKVHIDCFSDMNEQDMGQPEGPFVQPAQYRSILDKIETRLTALGIADQVPLLAGETSSTSSDWVVPLLSDPIVAPHLVHASFHNYYGDNGDFPSHLAGSGVDWWVTEYGDAFFDGDQGTPVSDEWTFDTHAFNQLLSHLRGGASGAMVYDGIDAYYEHHGGVNSLGQIEWDPTTHVYTIRKRMYANGLVDRFVRPGMVRIGSSTSDDGTINQLAFLDPKTGQTVTVGMNTGSSEAALNITLGGGLAASSFELFATDSGSLNMTSLGQAAKVGATFIATVPAGTMFALVSTPAPAGAAAGVASVDSDEIAAAIPVRRRRGDEAVSLLTS